MSNSSPKKKKASCVLLDDYDSPNSSTTIPKFDLDLNEGDPFKELNQVLSGEPKIESIHSSGRKRSHTIGSKPQPDQIDMVAELTSLRNQNTPVKVTSNEESEDKSSKFSSRLFGGFRKKSNEEKNKKKIRRKSAEVSKTEKKPTNTIKIHYQRQDSGTAKVLPLFDNDDARTIINTMLKKVSLLSIDIGDDLYQLQAITKEGVHIFADNEKPYQWMKKHPEIEFVCCKILIPLKSPRPTSNAPPPPTPPTPIAQSPARVDPTPSLPASDNVPRVTNIEALSDSDRSSESYSVSESDDDTPIVTSSPRRASGLSALVAAVSSNSVRGDVDLSKLPSVLSSSHRSLKALKPNNVAPAPPPLTSSTSSQTAPAIPPLPSLSNIESSDTSTHEYESDDSYSDDVLGDDKEEMFRAALALHASTVVKRSSGQYDQKLINHLRKSFEKPISPEAQIAKRVELIKELVDTERTYVRSLVFVEKSYITPIRQQKLMSEEDLNVVFSNLQTILAVHRELMSDLGARFYAATDSAPLIGDVFVHFSPFLKLYSTYYKQFDRADQTLKKCLKKSSKLRDFCQQVKSGPASRGLDLVSYLIMPVQRLPRYVLLLSQLLDLTYDEHSDFEPLTEALDKMQVVTKQADEALPPPPTTQAAKSLTALGDQFHELLSVAKNRDHGEVGNTDSNSSKSPLLLYGTAFEWDDGDCDDGSVVRLWLLQRWLVVAGGEKNDAALGVDGKPIGKKRGLFSVTPPAREPLRIPLSTIWVKRITWSDGRFEILSPLAEHSFFLEMNPHDRERWVNQIAKLTNTSNLSPSQIAERSLVDVQRVYDNQKHTASAWELKDLKREMETNLATIASIGQAHDTDQVEAYKTFIGERYAGRQRDTIQMFKKRLQQIRFIIRWLLICIFDIIRSRPSRASSRRVLTTPMDSLVRPKSPRKSPRSPRRLGKELVQPSLATASSTSSRPAVCQRCHQHRVSKSVRDKATKKRVYVCRACAAELPSRGSWHK